ncbi:MAG TPA: hypothetical protein VHB79_15750 [Polyangiaceae bacterium]|nr:hypothetical protein [Polyangiaceae bacterium]
MGALRTPVPRSPSRPDREVDEGALELVEVPAAVVCATCGLPECSCEIDRPSSFSGVVAIVPWERPGGTLLSRLWATAKLATLSPEPFFSALPPGGVAAPLAFGVLAETLAGAGLCATLGGLAALLFPSLAAELFANALLRGLVVEGLCWGVPALSLAMVLLHAAHGAALDAAARRAGSLQKGRGLRFGLYACGWDLVTLPLGLLVLTFTDGPLTALRYSARGLTAPNSAAVAYVAHVHRFERDLASRAARRAVGIVFVPMVALIVAGFAIGLLLAVR